MSELISGDEAKIAWVKGLDVEFYSNILDRWVGLNEEPFLSNVFDVKEKFRLKPRTIYINGIEVPAPFEPKPGELYYHPCGYRECGYWFNTNDGFDYLGAWRTEEEIKEVVAALRSIFNPK